MKTYYITTDLDLESPIDLQALADQVAENMLVHFCGFAEGVYRATFGLSVNDANENQAIAIYCDFADALDEQGRKAWDSCARIVFNLGYEAGNTPSTWRSTVSSDSVSRIANLGGEITVTIYRHDVPADA